MATEDLTGTDKFVDDLVATNPVATDSVSDGDEHIRGVKNVLKNTLPNVTAAVTATAAQLNKTASTFTGADGSAAGASGMVTTPVATDNTKFLKGDGTWATPSGGSSTTAGIIWDNHSTSTAYSYTNDGTAGTTSATAATDITVDDDKTLLLTHAADAGELRSVYVEKYVAIPGSLKPVKKIIITATYSGYVAFGGLRLYNGTVEHDLGTRSDTSNTSSTYTETDLTTTITSTASFDTARGVGTILDTSFTTNEAGGGYWMAPLASDSETITLVFSDPIIITNFDVGTNPDGSSYASRGANLSIQFLDIDLNQLSSLVSVSEQTAVGTPENYDTDITETQAATTYWQLESFDDWDVRFASSTTTKLINKTGADAVIRARITAPTASTGGGSGGTITAVASGALANGDKVILKSDGKVEVVGRGLTEGIPAGSEYVFNSGSTYGTRIAFDPNTVNKFVVAYRDDGNSYYGTAVVGTVSGTTITFGSEYIFNSASTDMNSGSIAFDPNNANKFVVAYRDSGNSNYGTAIVGTVSGTTISFGSEYVYNSATSEYNSIAFDPNTSGKFVIAYNDAVYNGERGRAIVGTVSGTTISYGSEYLFNTDDATHIAIAFDPNTSGKFVIAYRDFSNSYYGTAIVGTVSGTTISYGSGAVFNTGSSSDNSTDMSISFDTNAAGKFVVVYRDHGNSNYGTAIVGTVSGTTVSFGSEYVFDSGGVASQIFAAFDPNNGGKFVVAYKDGGNSNYGTAIVGQVSFQNLTADNFIGISDAAYADAATATIQVIGSTDDAQSGMTIGSNYYVQTDGTLATTAGSTSAFVGVALSATEILIGGATTLADLTDSTTATTDPLITSNQAVGHFWINSTSGEAYVCTDATTDENVWANVGSGTGEIRYNPYMVATGGAEVVTSGNYKYHIFTGTGSFVVTTQADSATFDFLVVAAGGSGGTTSGTGTSGGGGAGGYRLFTSQTRPTAASYTVTIGAGVADDTTTAQGSDGGDTAFNGKTSSGGGGGGGYLSGYGVGRTGGSGGGRSLAANAAGGAGNSGGYSPVEGFAGGDAYSGSWGGGGGGASEVGQDGTSSGAGAGGDGSNTASAWLTAIADGGGATYGDAGYFAGGGGGGSGSGTMAAGGDGGGGDGNSGGANSHNHVAGAANTGGGGGATNSGSTATAGATGGSGIVIIKYQYQ